jgi:hypothetical protein
MGLKDDLAHAGEHIKDAGKHLADAGGKLGEKVKDGVTEAAHRVAAESERKKRELLGDHLTPGEKAKSVAEEAKQGAQASVSGAKKQLDDV